MFLVTFRNSKPMHFPSLHCQPMRDETISLPFLYKWRARARSLAVRSKVMVAINRLTPNDHYRRRTAPLTSKRCILFIYSTNIGTEYFKHDIYSPFLSLQNAVCFIILTYLVPVLFTFHMQGVLKLKKNNSGAKRLCPKRIL